MSNMFNLPMVRSKNDNDAIDLSFEGNIDNRVFTEPEDGTATYQPQKLTEHQWLMNNDDKYRADYQFSNEPGLEDASLDMIPMGSATSRGVVSAGNLGLRVNKMRLLDKEVAKRTKMFERVKKNNPDKSDYELAQIIYGKGSPMNKTLLRTPETSLHAARERWTPEMFSNKGGMYNLQSNSANVYKPNGSNLWNQLVNGETIAEAKVKRNSIIAHEVGGKTSHANNIKNGNMFDFIHPNRGGYGNYLRSTEETAARATEYDYLTRMQKKLMSDGDIDTANKVAKELIEMKLDYKRNNLGFARATENPQLGETGNMLMNLGRKENGMLGNFIKP